MDLLFSFLGGRGGQIFDPDLLGEAWLLLLFSCFYVLTILMKENHKSCTWRANKLEMRETCMEKYDLDLLEI